MAEYLQKIHHRVLQQEVYFLTFPIQGMSGGRKISCDGKK